jgi:hypothetical protein
MSRKVNVVVTIAAVIALAALPARALGAASPTITRIGPGAVTDNTAVLRDDVNPEGSETHYFFQWGLTPAYGAASSPGSAGSGTKSVAVSFKATGLVPGTVYHYRVVAQNGVAQTVGADQTLKTGGPPPPSVATGAATSVGRNSATLTGVVNPNGAATAYDFQYGLTTAYGQTTQGGSVAAGSAPVTVAIPVGGLEAGVVFHFRIIALHGDSPPEYGADQTFMTEPFPRPVPRLTVASTPRRARAPFSLTTLGKVAGPSSIAPSLDCVGTVTVAVFHGRHRIARGTSTVGPGCTFSVSTAIPRVRGRSRSKHATTIRLKVVTAFAGNGYLAPRKRSQTVTLVRR